MAPYVSPEALAVPEIEAADEISRADLVFLGIDHSGPSYSVRVFFNNPEADLDTPTEADSGYAGEFSVFAHGACYGEEGHCDPEDEYRDVFDLRPPHPVEPITRTVVVTEALKRLDSDELTVTLVPVDHSGAETRPSEALALSEIRLLIYEA